MFIKEDLEIIRQALKHAVNDEHCHFENAPRASALLARMDDHIDYLCDECGGTGMWLENTTKQCKCCQGTGVHERAKTQKFFGAFKTEEYQA